MHRFGLAPLCMVPVPGTSIGFCATLPHHRMCLNAARQLFHGRCRPGMVTVLVMIV
ncbi:hypothetical protein OCAR_5620 [Afipia carboxidovorans OM5]|nr:hypothetical protein OCAR_5620 [Afipia carboxidovorans OM5]